MSDLSLGLKAQLSDGLNHANTRNIEAHKKFQIIIRQKKPFWGFFVIDIRFIDKRILVGYILFYAIRRTVSAVVKKLTLDE